jgi:hypothetical protein
MCRDALEHCRSLLDDEFVFGLFEEEWQLILLELVQLSTDITVAGANDEIGARVAELILIGIKIVIVTLVLVILVVCVDVMP